MDEETGAAFSRRMLDVLTGSAVSMLVSVGHRTGLFDAAVDGPSTSEDLAERAGLQERYVREWLGAMVTCGFFDYDAASGRYALPAARAASLTGHRGLPDAVRGRLHRCDGARLAAAAELHLCVPALILDGLAGRQVG